MKIALDALGVLTPRPPGRGFSAHGVRKADKVSLRNIVVSGTPLKPRPKGILPSRLPVFSLFIFTFKLSSALAS